MLLPEPIIIGEKMKPHLDEFYIKSLNIFDGKLKVDFSPL